MTFKDYLTFHNVLEASLSDILNALSLRSDGPDALVTPSDFIAAARVASGQEVAIDLVKVFFRTFDGTRGDNITPQNLRLAMNAFEVTFKEV